MLHACICFIWEFGHILDTSYITLNFSGLHISKNMNLKPASDPSDLTFNLMLDFILKSVVRVIDEISDKAFKKS